MAGMRTSGVPRGSDRLRALHSIAVEKSIPSTRPAGTAAAIGVGMEARRFGVIWTNFEPAYQRWWLASSDISRLHVRDMRPSNLALVHPIT